MLMLCVNIIGDPTYESVWERRSEGLEYYMWTTYVKIIY